MRRTPTATWPTCISSARKSPRPCRYSRKLRTHLLAALDVSADNPVARRLYRENQGILAKGYLLLGDHARLAATADDIARFAYKPADDSFTAAGMLSRCAALADKDVALAADRRRDLAQSYTERALAELRRAVERGFRDAARMKKDPHLEPLRGRPEFKKLLSELEAK